jgi:hypothetical protein
MAFEFDVNAVFKEACAMIAVGGRVAKLHGITPDGFCTCGKDGHHIDGSVKKQCGKHPSGGDGWQHRVARTEDDVEAWLEEYERDGVPFNIGVVLGPTTGIIDIEWDDPAGQQYAEQIGLTRIATPTYSSGRSEHRLFLWDDRFSQIDKAVVYPNGLEVRLGVGKKASQSVIPSSWHWKGVQYKWKPTLRIDEVELAKVPEELARAIVSGRVNGRPNAKAKSSRQVIHGDVNEGSRHPTLLALATKLVMRNDYYEDDDEQEDVFGLVWNTNLQRCKPPKSREEIWSIVHSCVSHRRDLEQSGEMVPKKKADIEETAKKIGEKAAAGDVKKSVSGYAMQGLEWKPVEGWSEGEWLPGSWEIQMIQSDPPEIVLCVNQWKDTPCKGKVQFAFDDFRSATKVANRVFSATRRVILDGDRGEWERVWRGQEGSKTKPKIRGLVEKLVDKKQADKEADIHVGASSLRFATLAAYLLETFGKATQPRDEDKPEPNVSGRPCWVKPDELWFKWTKVWEDIGRTHDVQAGERIRMRHLICNKLRAADIPERRHSFGTVRHSFTVFSHEWVEAVQMLAEGATSADGELALNTGVPIGVEGEKTAQEPRIPRHDTQVLAAQGVTSDGEF